MLGCTLDTQDGFMAGHPQVLETMRLFSGTFYPLRHHYFYALPPLHFQCLEIATNRPIFKHLAAWPLFVSSRALQRAAGNVSLLIDYSGGKMLHRRGLETNSSSHGKS